jgi:hypothetical protein
VNRSRDCELIHNLDVKSLGLFRRIALGAVFLLNSNYLTSLQRTFNGTSLTNRRTELESAPKSSPKAKTNMSPKIPVKDPFIRITLRKLQEPSQSSQRTQTEGDSVSDPLDAPQKLSDCRLSLPAICLPAWLLATATATAL